MEDNFESTKKRALRILGKRNFSEQEMHRRLVSKGEPDEAARETVSWLVEMGYINDDNYAALIVNHYTDKGYGEARIRDELSRRGIPREMWDERLCAARESDNSDAVSVILQKKLPGQPDKDDIQRAAETLVRRGFSYDEARDAVSKYLQEHSERHINT